MADTDITTINLVHDITVNGKTYAAGQNVAVPKGQADDIARLDYDHQQYERNLIRSRTYNQQVNSGQ